MTKARRRIRRSYDSRAGMTLVEVVVVIAIILALTTVLSFGVFEGLQTSREQTALVTIHRLDGQVVVYEAINGHIPPRPTASQRPTASRATTTCAFPTTLDLSKPS